MVSVMHICHNELEIDEKRKVEHVVLLGYELLPVGSVRMPDIDGDNASSRGVKVGVEIEEGTIIADKIVAGVGFVEQVYKGLFAGYFSIVDAIFRVSAMPDIKEQVVAILGDKWVKAEFFGVGSLKGE